MNHARRACTTEMWLTSGRENAVLATWRHTPVAALLRNAWSLCLRARLESDSTRLSSPAWGQVRGAGAGERNSSCYCSCCSASFALSVMGGLATVTLVQLERCSSLVMLAEGGASRRQHLVMRHVHAPLQHDSNTMPSTKLMTKTARHSSPFA